MQPLPRTLSEMYDLAEVLPMQAFPHELLRILKRVIPFDGAVLGAGSVGLPDQRRSEIRFISDSFDESFVLSVPSCTPSCGLLRKTSTYGRSRATCTDSCTGCIRAQPHSASTQEREVLLYAPTNSDHADWLALCRDTEHRFDARDREHLDVMWPHIVRSLAINRQRFLDHQIRQFDGRAGAVISAKGYIDIAEPHFHELLTAEWPGFTGDQLPPAVMDAWRGAHPYRGTKVEIRFREQDGCLFCIARPHAALDGLTKTEGIVARHFASGLNHREVAQTLGVSENTVRTHLKQAYSKLGVHDKAQLANRIGSTGY